MTKKNLAETIAKVDVTAAPRIKVRVHIPADVPDNMRWLKINKIYDILRPDMPENG